MPRRTGSGITNFKIALDVPPEPSLPSGRMVREDDMQPDLADRLKKSLNLADVSVQGMADFLECNRNSVGGWLNRRNKPFSASLMIWAQKTGVPYEWLRDGTWPGEDQYDDQAELPAPDRLRQMSAALWQIANQLERP